MDEGQLKSLVPEEHHGELDELITQMKTHKDPLAGITNEGFVELLKGNQDLSKVVDARTAKSITTWQENNLDKIYTERYAKEHPEDTEDQKRIKALEISTAESNARAARAELRTAGLTAMTEAKLPTALLDFLIGEDEEKTKANIALLEATLKERDTATKSAILKENGRVIPNHEDVAAKYFTLDQIRAMSPEEQSDEKNWQKIQESIQYWESAS
jgi:hypothetical protein